MSAVDNEALLDWDPLNLAQMCAALFDDLLIEIMNSLVWLCAIRFTFIFPFNRVDLMFCIIIFPQNIIKMKCFNGEWFLRGGAC